MKRTTFKLFSVLLLTYTYVVAHPTGPPNPPTPTSPSLNIASPEPTVVADPDVPPAPVEEPPRSNVVPLEAINDPDEANALSVELPPPPVISEVPGGRNSSSFDRQLKSLEPYLREVLRRYKVPEDLIPEVLAERLPKLSQTLKEVPKQDNEDDGDEAHKPNKDGSTPLRRRFGGRIKEILERVECALEAAEYQPIFMKEMDEFASNNPGPGKGVTRDQQFFLYPIHRDLPVRSRARLYFEADWVSSRWMSATATAIARKIYIRRKVQTDVSTHAFWAQMGQLVRAFAYTAQYEAVKYSKVAYSRQFLYHWCKANHDFQKTKLEVEAEKKQKEMEPLIWNRKGRRFFLLWKEKRLYDRLGYPTVSSFTDLTPTQPPSGQPWKTQLRFQKGTMEVQQFSVTRYCFRIRPHGQQWSPLEC